MPPDYSYRFVRRIGYDDSLGWIPLKSVNSIFPVHHQHQRHHHHQHHHQHHYHRIFCHCLMGAYSRIQYVCAEAELAEEEKAEAEQQLDDTTETYCCPFYKSRYAPQSESIQGILKEMYETMNSFLEVCNEFRG